MLCCGASPGECVVDADGRRCETLTCRIIHPHVGPTTCMVWGNVWVKHDRGGTQVKTGPVPLEIPRIHDAAREDDDSCSPAACCLPVRCWYSSRSRSSSSSSVQSSIPPACPDLRSGSSSRVRVCLLMASSRCQGRFGCGLRSLRRSMLRVCAGKDARLQTRKLERPIGTRSNDCHACARICKRIDWSLLLAEFSLRLFVGCSS